MVWMVLLRVIPAWRVLSASLIQRRLSAELLSDKGLLELACRVPHEADKVIEYFDWHHRIPELGLREELFDFLVDDSAHVNQVLRPEVYLPINRGVLLLFGTLARPVPVVHSVLHHQAGTKEGVHGVALW